MSAVYVLLKLADIDDVKVITDAAAVRCAVKFGTQVHAAQPVVIGPGTPGRFDHTMLDLDPEQTRVYGHEGIPTRLYAVLRASLRGGS
jgi:hypothetical protein